MKFSGQILVIATLVLVITACGGSSGGSNFTIGTPGNSSDSGSAVVSIGISDARVFDVKEVVITIDSITFRRVGSDDIVVDEFTSTDLGISNEQTLSIDLLEYQGSDQAMVIEGIELDSGEYSDLIVLVLDEDINDSYVLEADDSRTVIKVPSGTLKLGGFTVNNDGEQTFTIEFDLARSMAYRPGASADQDVYNLKPRGVRLQDNAVDKTINGTVSDSLFNQVQPCDDKDDPAAGNVMYLYSGYNLDESLLADAYNPDDSETAIPAGSIEPFALSAVVEAADGSWSYQFAFLPKGEYTLVFSCNAEQDDADNYDGLDFPLPDDQLIELDLNTDNSGAVCNFPIEDSQCG